jgi:hypothetical protein
LMAKVGIEVEVPGGQRLQEGVRSLSFRARHFLPTSTAS